MSDVGNRVKKPVNTAFLILLYVFLSPVVPISIRYLTFSMHNVVQNCLRMGAGSVTLLVISLVLFPRDLAAVLRSRRTVAYLAVLSVSWVATMLLYVEGVGRTSAAMGGLIGVVGIPLAVVLSSLLYHDERDVARDPRFAIGMIVAVAGTVGATLTAPGARVAYSLGVLLILASVILYSLSLLLLKHVLRTTHPFAAATVSSLLVVPQFLLLAAVSGRLGDIAEAPLVALIVGLASGALGLFLGVGLNYVLVQRIGVSRVSVLSLASPALTAAMAYLVIDDRMSPGQAVCGAVVLFGCWLTFRPGIAQGDG